MGKAGVLGEKANPRFIVTSLGEVCVLFAPAPLYEKIYCARGEMENRIKEQQLDLFADRLSCQGFATNEVRLWLSCFAYVLSERMRAVALRGSALARASLGTIRTRLLKVGVLIDVSVRRIRVRLSSAFPLRKIFVAAARQIQAMRARPG